MTPKIPKKVHYCWFGGGELPDLAKKCIESWHSHLPDYELKIWDESNSDFTQNRYIEEAYRVKKYAFVSDYVRLLALWNEGGIYLDTDVEVLKSLDPFLHHELFFGLESEDVVSSCIIGAAERHPLTGTLLEQYRGRPFIRDDGSFDTTPNTVVISNEMRKLGFSLRNKKQRVNDIVIYPKEVFCPKSYDEYSFTITGATFAIHHFAGSWHSAGKRRLLWFRVHVIKRFIPWLDPPLNALYHRFLNT